MIFEKPKRYENERYKELIRSKPCVSCSRPGPSDPHHIKTRGSGQGHDTYCTPLCRPHHQLQHSGNGLPLLVLYEGAVKYLTEYLRGIEP